MISRLICITLTLAAVIPLPLWAADIYLVRHAEKETDGSKDPALTATGSKRATDLAVLLKSANIERILSSDFVRTRETAAPTAHMVGVEIDIYDPKQLDALAKQLLMLRDNTLVVGHSNTTPDLVDLMGGEGGPPIVEEWEYDRVYMVQTEAGRVTRTILLHLPPSKVPPDSSE